MQITSSEKSYFYYICYYSLYLDLIIIYLNPFQETLKVFSNPIEYSFYVALLFSCTFKTLFLYLNDIQFARRYAYKANGKLSKFLKKISILFIFLLVFGLFIYFASDPLKDVSKIKIFATMFLMLTTFWPLLSKVFSNKSNLNKSLFKNGIYFNLACFSARWLSFSSALVFPFYEYGFIMFFASFALAFYFMHTFLALIERN